MSDSSPLDFQEKTVSTGTASPEAHPAWYKGFVLFLTSPGRCAALFGRPSKLFVAALLIEMAGQLLLAWSWSTDPQLIRQQQELVQQSSPIKREREAAEKNIESASKSEIFFNPVAVISASLPERGVRILGMAAMVWFVGAFFSPIVLRYQDVLTLVSYSSIITFVGFAVTSIMQTASGQIGFGPNLGLMIDPKSNALLFAFLNNVGPFSLWAYIATGLALAARITRPPAIGVLIGALSFVGMLGSLLLIMWLIRTGLNLIGAIA